LRIANLDGRQSQELDPQVWMLVRDCQQGFRFWKECTTRLSGGLKNDEGRERVKTGNAESAQC
jgi:hypothetical protein